MALQTDPSTPIDTWQPLTAEIVKFAATFGPWPMDALAVLETATMASKVHGHFDLMRDSSFVHLRTRAELASSAGSGLRGRRLIVRALHHVNRAIFEAIAMSGQPWVPDIAGLFLFGNPFARENFEAARLHMHGIHGPRLPQLLMENVGRAMVAWLLSRPGTDANAYRAARAAVLQGSNEGHAALEQALALHDVPTHGFKSLTVIGDPRYCFLTTDEGFVLQKVSKEVHGYHLSGVRYLAPYPEDWSTFEYPGPIEELARLRRKLESALFDNDAPASMSAEERQLLASLL